jgi:hypothetical protein
MFKRTITALALAAVAFVGVQAQENATLTLRSGEKVQGFLVDMGGVGFTINVNGNERIIPTNDVAVIDFAGGNMTNEDWARVNAGQQVIWFRSGEVLNASLYDIGGTTPLRLTFKTANGERIANANEVSRIVLARTDAAVAGTTGTATPTTGNLAPATGSGLVISARQAWTPTGITVRRGEVLTFNTTGEIQLSADTNDVAGSAGAKSQRYAASSPLPRNFAGALIARVGNQVFPIGNQTTVTMPATGQLFLGINDDGFEDNAGEFRVEIGRSNRRR